MAGGRKSPESSTTLSSCIAPWSVARFINSFLIIISLLTEQFSITLSCFETLIRPQVIVILSLLLMSFSLEHLYYTEEEIAVIYFPFCSELYFTQLKFSSSTFNIVSLLICVV